MIPVLAGIGAYIGANAILGTIHVLARSNSQFMNVLLQFSVFALLIRIGCWALAAWAGWSVFVTASNW